jgi:hypothetical protein
LPSVIIKKWNGRTCRPYAAAKSIGGPALPQTTNFQVAAQKNLFRRNRPMAKFFYPGASIFVV